MRFDFEKLGKIITESTKGFSVRQNAELIGISSATFHRASKGKAVDVNTLIVLLAHFGLELETFIIKTIIFTL